MLYDRYRTERLSQFWSTNREGNCLLGPSCSNTSDTISHILVVCPVLQHKRSILKSTWLERESDSPLYSLITQLFTWDIEEQTKFLLDPLSNPYIIALSQNFGDKITNKICYLTRTFCFSLHRERKIILGKWYNSGYPAPNIICQS